MKIQSTVAIAMLFAGLSNAEAQTVLVPSKSTTDFVKVITVTTPSLIQLTASGKISSGSVKNITPKGVSRNLSTCQNPLVPCHPLPLHKSAGVDFKSVPDFGALVGYFVPKSTQQPSSIFFVGNYNEYITSEAGGLFLGINENEASDNTGNFSVQVTSKVGERITVIEPVIATGDDDVSLKIGQKLVIELEANATTGYSWSVVENNENYLKSEGEDYIISPSCQPMMVGCGGTSKFTYTADAKGSGNLKLKYAQPWDSSSLAETVDITYTIE
jgi:inhibitor of cysteine peptidase